MSVRPHPTVIAISAATAFSLLGDQMLYAVLPAYYEQLGLTAIEVGILLSANRWIRLATNQIAHAASPRLSPRVLLTGAFTLGAITTLGYAATASFTVLVSARIAWGLAWSFIRHVGVLEVVAHAPADAGGRAIGFYNGISRIGSVAGLLGGAALVDAFGYVPAVLPARCGLDRQRCARAARSFARDAAAAHARRCTGDAARPTRHRRTVARLLARRRRAWLRDVDARRGAAAIYERIDISRHHRRNHHRRAARDPVRDRERGRAGLGATSDRWGIRRTAMRFFLLGGVALLAACAQPDSLPLLALFLLAFYASSTALQSGVSATVSAHGSAAYARYVTAGDIGSATGPLLGWIAVDAFGYAAVGLMLGGAVYLIAALVSRAYLR